MKPTNPDFSPTASRGGSAVQWTTFLGLIVLAAATRLLPHPENLTAMGAVALFGGVYFRRWPVAVLVPLSALLVSDFILCIAWSGANFSQWQFMSPIHYVLFGLTVFAGWAVRNRPTPGALLGTTIMATLGYFLASNFSEWYSPESGTRLYPMTIEGLTTCYIAGLPFLRNMLIGNLLYLSLLFCGWHVLQQFGVKRELAPVKVAA